MQRFSVICSLLACCLVASIAQADRLPEPVQSALESAAEAHRPHPDLMHGLLGLSRSRFGSGTSWQPSASPMYGLMRAAGDFALLLRGNIFAGYAAFSSTRGTQRFFNSNTLLAVMWGRWGRHEWMPRLALSWEALTNGQRYPHVLQTDADQHRPPLFDRQTPQDVFGEISSTYSVEISKTSAFQLYTALVGEAALGPSAYNYRVSSFSDPLPPISQSVLETGASYLVFTAGMFWAKAKLEASWFNARRSARRQYDLDVHMPRSISARLSLQPSPAWNAQVSYGYLNGFHQPWSALRSQRLNASVSYNHRIGTEANWAATFAAGGRRDAAAPTLPAALMETTWNIEGHQTLFGRIEYARVHAQALGLTGDGRRRISNFVFGYIYYFRAMVSFAPGIGVRASVAPVDRSLEHTYGTRFPLGLLAYVQLRPAALAVQNVELELEGR